MSDHEADDYIIIKNKLIDCNNLTFTKSTNCMIDESEPMDQLTELNQSLILEDIDYRQIQTGILYKNLSTYESFLQYTNLIKCSVHSKIPININLSLSSDAFVLFKSIIFTEDWVPVNTENWKPVNNIEFCTSICLKLAIPYEEFIDKYHGSYTHNITNVYIITIYSDIAVNNILENLDIDDMNKVNRYADRISKSLVQYYILFHP